MLERTAWRGRTGVDQASGKGVDRERVEKAVALSTDKYCGVHGTLTPQVKVTWHVEIVQG